MDNNPPENLGTPDLSSTEATNRYLSSWSGRLDLALLGLTGVGQVVFGGLGIVSLASGDLGGAALGGALAVADRAAGKLHSADISNKIAAVNNQA